VNEDFRGNLPTGVLGLVVTSTPTGNLSNITPLLAGQILTLTFGNGAPLQLSSGQVIVYTATFYLQYGE
jgi:hypothetical protein